MRLATVTVFALAAVAGVWLYRRMNPPDTAASAASGFPIPTIPATVDATAWGSPQWATANMQTHDPYASSIRWEPSSRGYGWDGTWYPVNAGNRAPYLN